MNSIEAPEKALFDEPKQPVAPETEDEGIRRPRALKKQNDYLNAQPKQLQKQNSLQKSLISQKQ